MEERSPGLLLQVIPYLGKQKILKVFTPEAGLVSLIEKKHSSGPLTPFCLAEWVYRKGNRDICLLLEVSVRNHFLELRSSYRALCAAGQISQDLLKVHMPGGSSFELFALASSFFQQMSFFEHPEVLVMLFRLKWLQQEGLLSFRSACSLCGASALHVHRGESYCLSHALQPGWTFSREEWTYLERLCAARSFTELKTFGLISALFDKISLFFQEHILP
ncbi:MAG: recombination protein O N-terminal domain-containing protein [Chlamydiales bacterium]|nr:recombination protein O N-terminal domain-containing protein [Chlamydiales bacterium]